LLRKQRKTLWGYFILPHLVYVMLVAVLFFDTLSLASTVAVSQLLVDARVETLQ